MRIVFCGTPSFAVPTLKHLLAQKDFEVAGVITQPDRPRGRGHEVSFSAVKEAALAAKVAVHQPEKIRAAESEALLRKLAPDYVMIIAYGQIVPARLLPIPKLGWINLHASLLPKYRGAAPINWAIANGGTLTGLTTMRIDAGMDTGDMLLNRELEIGAHETAPELTIRMAELGAPLLKKEDGRIDWKRPAIEIYNRMRGFAPWPGAYTTFRGQSCHLWGEVVSKEGSASVPAGADPEPGTLFFEKNEFFVWCGDATVLRLRAVKLEGRKQVSAAEFANGAHLKSGERFGDT